MDIMDFYSSDIYELSYISRAAQNFESRALLRLVERSRRWNEQHQITSILFYGNNSFCQILEGPLRDLDLVCRRIRNSVFHHKIQHLEMRQIGQRSIPEYPLRLFAEDGLRRQFPVLADEMAKLSFGRIELTRAIRAAALEASSGLALTCEMGESA